MAPMTITAISNSTSAKPACFPRRDLVAITLMLTYFIYDANITTTFR